MDSRWRVSWEFGIWSLALGQWNWNARTRDGALADEADERGAGVAEGHGDTHFGYVVMWLEVGGKSISGECAKLNGSGCIRTDRVRDLMEFLVIEV
jgi:hypothetical protein